MKSSILFLGVVGVISLLFIGNFGVAITPSAVWPVSTNDVYYVTWLQHPLVVGKYPLITSPNYTVERVNVSYEGPGLGVYNLPAQAYFDNSVNVTGDLWSGASWVTVSDNNSQNQLTLYNSSLTQWFCGGLFTGAPCIAPSGLSAADRKNTIFTDTNIIWGSGSTLQESGTNWTFSRSNKTLTVSYNTDGFITYYYLFDGNNTWECNIQVTEPLLPAVSTSTTSMTSTTSTSSSSNLNIGGFPISIINLGIVISIIFLRKKCIPQKSKMI